MKVHELGEERTTAGSGGDINAVERKLAEAERRMDNALRFVEEQATQVEKLTKSVAKHPKRKVVATRSSDIFKMVHARCTTVVRQLRAAQISS